MKGALGNSPGKGLQGGRGLGHLRNLAAGSIARDKVQQVETLHVGLGDPR